MASIKQSERPVNALTALLFKVNIQKHDRPTNQPKSVVIEQHKKSEWTDTKNRSYSEVAWETLHLKVVLAEKKPCEKELMKVKMVLMDNVIEAIKKGEKIPTFNDNVIKSDGLHLTGLRNVA